MKSLKIFMESKSSRLGIKISSFPYSYHDNIMSVPFYGVEQLKASDIKNTIIKFS